MNPLLIVLAAASQMLYEAQVPTFGCNSSAEVSTLQSLRSDENAFQGLLYEKVLQGECVVFMKGAVVEGSTDGTDTSVLRVQAQNDPPGYMAPLDDFKPKNAEIKQ